MSLGFLSFFKFQSIGVEWSQSAYGFFELMHQNLIVMSHIIVNKSPKWKYLWAQP